MKNLLLLISFLVLTVDFSSAQNVAINASGNAPAASSMLDIDATGKGLLIPRMTTAQRPASPVTSLIIYNTTLAWFEYWDGTAWVPFLSSGSGWTTSGNTLTGTLPATPNEWIGTINAADWIIKTGNTERMRVDANGNVGIGTIPSWDLDIAKSNANGYVISNIKNTSAGANAGAGYIAYNDNNKWAEMTMGSSNATSLTLGLPNANFANFYTNATLALGTSTANPILIGTSGTEYMRMTSNGNVGIRTTTPATPLEVIANSTNTNTSFTAVHFGGTQSVANTSSYGGLLIDPAYSAAGTLTSMYGLAVANQNTSTGTIPTMQGIISLPENVAGGSITNLQGFWTRPQNSGAGNVTTVSGYSSVPRNTGTGTVTNMPGLFSNPANTSTGTVTTMIAAQLNPQKTGTGPVTTMYGALVRLDNTNAVGAVTTGYGIYIDDPTATGAFTNKYALITASSAGNVGIGTPTPSSPLHVKGALPTGSFIAKIENTISGGELLEGINDLGNEVISWRTDPGGGFMTVCTTAGTRSTTIAAGTSYFLGSVGVGTSNPGTALEVDGTSGSTLKIVDGNQGTGKVLTSDLNGVASWGNGATTSGSGFTQLLYNDETTSSGNATATSVKSYTVSGTYSQIKVEADIEADCQVGGAAPGWSYAFLYNGVTVKTSKIIGPSASASWYMASMSYSGTIASGQIVSMDIPAKTGTNAGTTWYVRSFRVYAVY